MNFEVKQIIFLVKLKELQFQYIKNPSILSIKDKSIKKDNQDSESLHFYI